VFPHGIGLSLLGDTDLLEKYIISLQSNLCKGLTLCWHRYLMFVVTTGWQTENFGEEPIFEWTLGSAVEELPSSMTGQCNRIMWQLL